MDKRLLIGIEFILLGILIISGGFICNPQFNDIALRIINGLSILSIALILQLSTQIIDSSDLKVLRFFDILTIIMLILGVCSLLIGISYFITEYFGG